MAETQQPNGNQQDWDTSKYEEALAHLEKLQEQLDALRSAIPSVVAPLMKANMTKTQLFVDIKTAAVTSTTELKDFRDNWTSEQTQSLLAKSQESKQKDGDLSKLATVPRYGWSEGK